MDMADDDRLGRITISTFLMATFWPRVHLEGLMRLVVVALSTSLGCMTAKIVFHYAAPLCFIAF